MLRIDGAYLYELGAKLRPISSMSEEPVKKLRIAHIIAPAIEELSTFLTNSVFSPHLRTVKPSADRLLQALQQAEIDYADQASFDHEVTQWTLFHIKNQFRNFESVLLAELQSSPLYLAFSKGGFDVACLTDAGWQLFPADLPIKVPNALNDAQAGAKCIAFELWTAAGFHFHRVNEAVLRSYFDEVAGKANRPKTRNMGDYLKVMRDKGVGDPKVLAVLQSIKDLHRNPLMHPGDEIETADEALSLYAAIRACIGYMLDRIPATDLLPA